MPESILIVSNVLLWLFIALMGIFLWVTFRLIRDFVKQLESSGLLKSNSTGLRQGELAPQFSLVSTQGSPISNRTLTGDLNALLFVSPNCPTCAATTMELEGLAFKTSGNIHIVCLGEPGECHSLEDGLTDTFPFSIDADGVTGRTFGIVGTPTAVLIDGEGRIDRFGNPTRALDLQSLAPELFEQPMDVDVHSKPIVEGRQA